MPNKHKPTIESYNNTNSSWYVAEGITKPLILIFSEPYTEILGDSPEDSNTLYIDIRSVLNLTCVVYSPEVPAAIFWKHNGKV